MNKNASGGTSLITSWTGGVRRWDFHIGDTTAEGGGNAGSDFSLWSYADGGGVLANPLKVVRSSGQTILSSLQVSGVIGCNGQGFFGGNLTAAPNGGIAANCVTVGWFQSGAWYNGQMLGVNVNNTTGIIGFGSSQNMQWSNGASDRLRKAKIKKPDRDALAIVRGLPIWSCDYAPKPATDDPVWRVTPEHWPFSFMADEVDALMPHATIKDIDDSHPVALHPHHLVAVLWAAVQQLTARLEALEGAK
jgi:hypothetical protein